MTACVMCGFDPGAEVAARWTFEIRRELTSLNSRSINAGASRWTYGATRSAWVSDLIATMRVHGIGEAKGRRRVTMTRIIGHRQRDLDRDNLVGGSKVIADAMVIARMLVDDSANHAEIHVKQVRDRDRRGVVFVVEELR